MWSYAIWPISASSVSPKLIPTTELIETYDGTSDSITVKDTSAFQSGAGFLYINSGSGISTSSIWYSGKTSSTFTGVTGASGIGTYLSSTKIFNDIETDNTLYDYDYLLTDLGDIVYKNTDVNDFLDTQEKVDKRAKDYLKEFVKNHTKLDIDIMYSPHLQIGNTVRLIDSYNQINDLYFIESIDANNESLVLTVARYPE